MSARMSVAHAVALTAVAWVLVATLEFASGCSSTTNSEAVCGAGTTPQNGVCVVADAGQSDGPATGDGTVPEGSVDAMAKPDVASEASNEAGPPQDASDIDVRDAAQYDADPCPVNTGTQEYAINCDPNCQAEEAVSQQVCQTATCSGGGTYAPGAPARCNQVLFVRPPSQPATDPQCSSDCPGSGWTYGLSMTFTSFPGGYSMVVSPPWYLIGGAMTPFCPAPDAGAASCLWFDGTQGEVVYLVTNDPMAPAKNLVIQCASQDTCPQ